MIVTVVTVIVPARKELISRITSEEKINKNLQTSNSRSSAFTAGTSLSCNVKHRSKAVTAEIWR